MPKAFFGITVLSPHIQNEGVERVLDNVQYVGANAVAVNTSVVAPAATGEGSFQPPDDAGSSPRLLERPLWAKHALWLRSGPGHRADPDCFAQSPYQPRQANDLTDSDGPIIAEFISAAKARGLQVYIQTSATAPPGLRDEDTPRLPDGQLPTGRMAATGCLASPAIRAYNRAWTKDIFQRYPEIDGIRPDWPEYPCYTLGEAFQDFNPQVANFCEQHGFDFEGIQHDVLAFYQYLYGQLKDADLIAFSSLERGHYMQLALLNQYPGVADWFRLKAALSVDLLRDWRQAIKSFGGPDKELSANAFMPPYSYVTGLDIPQAAKACTSISVKLYTMHWSLMVNFWAEALLEANPGLSETLMVASLVNLLDLADPGQGGTQLADYGYPKPDQAHPIPSEVQQRKLSQALSAARGHCQINALVHGYGPLEDVTRRVTLAFDSNVDGIWLNRYGYLGDAKLAAIAALLND